MPFAPDAEPPRGMLALVNVAVQVFTLNFSLQNM